MKTKAPQFDLPIAGEPFNLSGERIPIVVVAVAPPPPDTRTLELFPKPKCGKQAFGFMPPCVLDKGHTGSCQDGFGGFYEIPDL